MQILWMLNRLLPFGQTAHPSAHDTHLIFKALHYTSPPLSLIYGHIPWMAARMLNQMDSFVKACLCLSLSQSTLYVDSKKKKLKLNRGDLCLKWLLKKSKFYLGNWKSVHTTFSFSNFLCRVFYFQTLSTVWLHSSCARNGLFQSKNKRKEIDYKIGLNPLWFHAAPSLRNHCFKGHFRWVRDEQCHLYLWNYNGAITHVPFARMDIIQWCLKASGWAWVQLKDTGGGKHVPLVGLAEQPLSW